VKHPSKINQLVTSNKQKQHIDTSLRTLHKLTHFCWQLEVKVCFMSGENKHEAFLNSQIKTKEIGQAACIKKLKSQMKDTMILQTPMSRGTSETNELPKAPPRNSSSPTRAAPRIAKLSAPLLDDVSDEDMVDFRKRLNNEFLIATPVRRSSPSA
jgi:hypothetical protein